MTILVAGVKRLVPYFNDQCFVHYLSKNNKHSKKNENIVHQISFLYH